MELKIYSIRDAKGGFFNTPFIIKHSHGEAEREFTQLVRNPNSTLNQFPEDFDLYFLGGFDNVEGKMQLVDSPQHVMKAIHCIASTNPQITA